MITADFGHGLITSRAVEILGRKAGFLADNTQINAANNGYHTLSKYPRADYVCVHEGEIRLDQRDRTTDLHQLMEHVSCRMGAQTVTVTRGKNGTLMYNREQGFCKSPGLAVKVVDRVGAGDSVLAISSTCAAPRTSAQRIRLHRKHGGGSSVAIVGNRSAISRQQLLEGIDSVLK